MDPWKILKFSHDVEGSILFWNSWTPWIPLDLNSNPKIPLTHEDPVIENPEQFWIRMDLRGPFHISFCPDGVVNSIQFFILFQNWDNF